MQYLIDSRVLKVILPITFLFINCDNNPQNDSTLAENVLWLASADEPGERLILNFIVTNSVTGAPLPDANVYLYQADTNGEYHPSEPSDESTAKLSGEIITDKYGRFTIKTILPGEYDTPGNRHIHIHYARAEGYKQTGGVILFEKNVNDETRQWANKTGYGIIIEIETVNGVLTGNINLKLEPSEK